MKWPTATWTTVLLAIVIASGCGTTKLQEATEQLTLSSAVDRSVSMIDFRALAGHSVYLDTTYLQNRSLSFVNIEYVTSALRQQIMAGGCFLQEKKEDADIIIEPRIGTLGADEHRVTYGVPENSGIGMAANLVARTPSLAVPEIAVARRDAREAAAKIAAFAYDRETKTPVWQSGISQSISTSRNTWVLGIGPFQGGSIREGGRLAKGTSRSGRARPGASPQQGFDRPAVEYTAEVRYIDGWPVTQRVGSEAVVVGSGLPLPIAQKPFDAPEQRLSQQNLSPTETLSPDEPVDAVGAWPAAAIAEDHGMVEEPTLRR